MKLVLPAIVLFALIAALDARFGVPHILLLLGAVVLALTWFTERTMTGRHIDAMARASRQIR